LILGAVASSISEYMTAHNFPLKHNKINVIYNMKEPPKSKKDFYYHNFAYSEMLDMNFSEDFYDCMK